MSAKRRNRSAIAGICGVALLSLLLACTAESPTAPEQVPAPVPTPGDDIWNITISVSPSTLLKTVNPADADPSVVTVTVKKKSGGSSPPTGTTMVLSTSLGEFSAVGSAITDVVLQLAGGRGEALLYPGSLAGTGRLTAQLEGSIGQKSIRVEEQDTLFITSLTPASGGEDGRTRVSVNGVGFTSPLQVVFGEFPAVVVKVANDGTSVKVDSPAILDPQAFFNTEQCDSNNDGELDGEAFLPTAVTVTVTLQSGPIASASFANGFTYWPADRSCRAAPPDPDPPFIQEVIPNRGPEVGGQLVEIRGRGFRQPLRVFIQNKLADVISVSRGKIVVTTPPGDMDTEACEELGNPGTRDIPTPVKVEVEIIDGATESLDGAYTYDPANTDCQVG